MKLVDKKKLLYLAVFLVLQVSMVLAAIGQDTMITKVQKESGQTSPIIIWLFIALIPILFLIFAVRRGNKAKKNPGNATNNSNQND